MKKICIVSLKFSIGLYKEMLVHEKQASQKNFDVIKIFSNKYQTIDNNKNSVYVKSGEGFINIYIYLLKFLFFPSTRNYILNNLKDADIILFYNTHPLNYLISKSINKFDKKLIQFIHEPYMPDKSKYGFLISIRIFFIELIQSMIYNNVDHLAVPSNYAKTMLESKYNNLKNKIIVSPLFQSKINMKNERRYFTIIGRDHPAKNFNLFFNLIREADKKNLSFNFCIISKSNISKYIEKLTINQKKMLKIISKELISDEEINEVLAQSYSVFKLDNAITQSGIVALCGMMNVPVIANDIPGFSQDIIHKKTGYLLDVNKKNSTQLILNYMKEIIVNVDFFKVNIERYYNKKWNPSNWHLTMGSLIN